MVAIRYAIEADAAPVSETLISSIRTLCVTDHRNDRALVAAWTANKAPEDVAGWIEDKRTSLFIAEDGGGCAGVGAIDSGGRIILNYVHPRCRFQGVSRALLTRMELALISIGVKEGRLECTKTAHRFFLDAGWRDGGEAERMLGMAVIPMRKQFEVGT